MLWLKETIFKVQLTVWTEWECLLADLELFRFIRKAASEEAAALLREVRHGEARRHLRAVQAPPQA